MEISSRYQLVSISKHHLQQNNKTTTNTRTQCNYTIRRMYIAYMDTYRIVEGRVHLRGDDSSHKGESVIDDAMHLRYAAQCVGILYSAASSVSIWEQNMIKELSHGFRVRAPLFEY